jgi:hypothetical protein
VRCLWALNQCDATQLPDADACVWPIAGTGAPRRQLTLAAGESGSTSKSRIECGAIAIH